MTIEEKLEEISKLAKMLTEIVEEKSPSLYEVMTEEFELCMHISRRGRPNQMKSPDVIESWLRWFFNRGWMGCEQHVKRQEEN
jgi:hypothetical protein